MNNKNHEVVIKVHRPDLKEKLFFLISGIIVSIPLTLFFGTFAERLCIVLPVFYATVCSVVIFTPFIEEFAKAFPLFYRHGETERSIFILGFLVGLGFGISEFLVYVFALDAPILVRLPGIFFHAASAGIIAYGIAKKQPVIYYLIAVGLHFLNNFSALFDVGVIGFIVANLACYFLAWDLYRKTSEKIIDHN
ncbi:PrsW family glutamic-type intramembrane protease [Methanobacterium sp. ACI-7]|uniref:PrsW family glutamic-type intramembrane protease n=1 Tax=unclassified Methanobacterium TaxID=2627676 RepID=UPI0039C35B93